MRATGWLLVGLLQLAVIVVVFGPLQRWRPRRRSPTATIRTDMLYTLLHRLGLFRVLLFVLTLLSDMLFGASGWSVSARCSLMVCGQGSRIFPGEPAALPGGF